MENDISKPAIYYEDNSMLKVTVSEATYESSEFKNFAVFLSRFDNPNQGMLEFRNKLADKRYTITYSRFTSICELIFLSNQLTQNLKLPFSTAVKQFINTQDSNDAVIVDIVSKTISIGFMNSNGYGNELENDSVNAIPFALFNDLNKTIERDILLTSKIDDAD